MQAFSKKMMTRMSGNSMKSHYWNQLENFTSCTMEMVQWLHLRPLEIIYFQVCQIIIVLSKELVISTYIII